MTFTSLMFEALKDRHTLLPLFFIPSTNGETQYELISWVSEPVFLGWEEKGRNETMLGDLVFEGQGKIIGMRVLPNGKMENTGIMKGMFYGEEFSSTWTSENEMRPDGTAHSEELGIFTTISGERGRYSGMCNGICNPDGTQSYKGAVCFSNPPGKYTRLNGIAGIYEMEFDNNGNYQMKGWEWK
jgi:hypothetical protein